MISTTATNIKQRLKPNDVFITPLLLARQQIDMIEFRTEEVWYDPFKNSGSYYNQYPTDNKEWSEILEDKDFFTFNKKIDVICSNPPYSFIDKVLTKCIELKPRVISLLIGVNNLTARRIEIMNKSGYGLKKLHMCKVWKWFGMSYIVQFEKGEKNCISYDRVVWK